MAGGKSLSTFLDIVREHRAILHDIWANPDFKIFEKYFIVVVINIPALPQCNVAVENSLR